MAEVVSGASSGIHAAGVQLIGTAAEWEKLWAEMTSPQSPPPALPEVNFEEKMLLAAFRGDCASSGYGLEIRALQAGKKHLTVSLRYTTPGPQCMLSSMITQPYEIVEIDRVEAQEIQVSVENKVIDCGEEAVIEELESGTEPVRWKEVASGAYCGYHEEKRMLILDQIAWQALWEQVGSNQIPPPALPEVNFDEKALVALFMGDRGSGGYGQSIKKMEMENGRLVVRLIHGSPGKNCISTMAIVQPYTIVAIDKKYAKDPSFAIEKVVRDCN